MAGERQQLRGPRFLRYFITALCFLGLILIPATPAIAQVGSLSIGTTVGTPPPPAPAPSGIGVRLLDVPAATQNDPRARSYIVDRLAPGTKISRRIEVENNSDSARSVRIYAGAAHIDGGSFVGGNDPAVNELTTWTSVDQPNLELAPESSAKVTVTIDVPHDAPESEQYAAIWAEIRDESAPGTNIAQASRAGIRVYVSVGEGNGKPANFSIDAMVPGRTADGAPELTGTVTNTGGRALDIFGSLMLNEGPAGLSAGPTPIDKGTTIAPGSSGVVQVTLPAEIPSGPWQATLELKSGLVVHEAIATITFPDSGQGAVVAPEKGPNAALIAIGVAVLTLVTGLILWWLRRRKNLQDQSQNTA